jgi:hypothetical protein
LWQFVGLYRGLLVLDMVTREGSVEDSGFDVEYWS